MAKTRIASIDYGKKRLGVALSDESRMIASPLGTIEAGRNEAETIRRLLELLKPYALERIILGYPLHLSGKESPLSEEVKRFQIALQAQVPFEVTLQDERLSTSQANLVLKLGGLNRKKRSKVVDTVSAVIILQSYLGY